MADWFKIITDPEVYLTLEVGGKTVGIYLLLLLAFAEAALFAGLFYSSDSFLFIAGMYSHLLINQFMPIENENIAVFILAILVAAASIMGNLVAYSYGAKAENYFENKQDDIIYKRKYLEKSKVFFDNYGAWAVIAAHYMPLVRTFMPMLAAISGMRFPRFAIFVSISSTLWSFSFLLLGHYLYQFLLSEFQFDLKAHLWLMLLVLIGCGGVFMAIKSITRKLKNVD